LIREEADSVESEEGLRFSRNNWNKSLAHTVVKGYKYHHCSRGDGSERVCIPFARGIVAGHEQRTRMVGEEDAD
jgi:hypothetical protein